MNLLEVLPLTRLPKTMPDSLSYYTSRDIPAGSFVSISIQKKKITGIVLKSSALSSVKAIIRKQDFAVRKIDDVLTSRTIPASYIKLYLWTAKFFVSCKNLVFKTALPNYFAKPSKSLTKFLRPVDDFYEKKESMPAVRTSEAPIAFLEGSFHERTERYASELWTLRDEDPRAQMLILFPTYSDARAFYEKIKDGQNYVVLYESSESSLTAAASWKKIVTGDTRVVIGTRNAVFIPMPFLSRIIVDGENSPYYKSWDSDPRLDTRDVAEKLSSVFSIPLIIGGNMPREETWYRILQQEIRKESLGKEKNLPVTIISRKKNEWEQKDREPFRAISKTLEEKIKIALVEKKKLFFFSGRRGYSANILCGDCGYAAVCSQCEAPLVIHTGDQSAPSRFLLCHKCLKRESSPTICPECRGNRMQSFGTGTQKIEEELKQLFPSAVILRIDADTAETPEEQQALFKKSRDEHFDILIGTESALKPSSLPPIAVGIITSLNQLLQQPDFRQEERVFSIIRTVREIVSEALYVQTSFVDAPLIVDIEQNDYEAFFKRDIVFRKSFFYPPFAEIITVTVKNSIRLLAEKNALITRRMLEEESTKAGISPENIRITGPIPAFIQKEKKEFVYRIIVKVKDQNDRVKEILRDTLPPYASCDVNPKSVL